MSSAVYSWKQSKLEDARKRIPCICVKEEKMKSIIAKISVMAICAALLVMYCGVVPTFAADKVEPEAEAAEMAPEVADETDSETDPEPAEKAEEESADESASEAEISDSEEEILSDEESAESTPEEAVNEPEAASEAPDESLYPEVSQRVIAGEGYADVSDLGISADQSDSLFDYLGAYADSISFATSEGRITYVFFNEIDEDEYEEAEAKADAEAEAAIEYDARRTMSTLTETVCQRLENGNGFADISDLGVTEKQTDLLSAWMSSTSIYDYVSFIIDGDHVMYVTVEDSADYCDDETFDIAAQRLMSSDTLYAEVEDLSISEDLVDELEEYLSDFSKYPVEFVISEEGYILAVLFDDSGIDDAKTADTETEASVVSAEWAEEEVYDASDSEDAEEELTASTEEIAEVDENLPLEESEQSPEEPVGAVMGLALCVAAVIRHLAGCL